MRNMKYILGFIIVLLLVANTLCYGIHYKSGTRGMKFLQIPVDSRGSAMGEAAIVSSRHASVLFWNPSRSVYVDDNALSMYYNKWIEGLSHYYAGAVKSYDNYAIGFGIIYLSSGEIDGYNDQQEYIGQFDAIDFAAIANGSYRILPFASVGINAKLLLEELDVYHSYGYAVDLGLFYETNIKNLDVAAVITNLGKADKMIEEEIDLPRTIKLGASYRYLNIEDFAILGEINAVKPVDNDYQGSIGLEVCYKEQFEIRTGYKYNHDTIGLSFGAGFNIENFSFDYSYVPTKDEYEFGNSQRVSLNVKF